MIKDHIPGRENLIIHFLTILKRKGLQPLRNKYYL